MMETRIIKDRAEWEYWLSQTQCDVYDSYDYVKVNCGSHDSPELFVANTSKGMLIYPYIRRRIDQRYDDLVTAYGYGGPFRVGEFTDDEVKVARHTFLLREENGMTVTETIRYHPLRIDEAIMKTFGQAFPIRKTVHVQLDKPYGQLTERFHKMTKRNVKRATREQLTVVQGGAEDIQTFIRLYEETMNRRSANDDYYYSTSYFSKLLTSESFEAEFLFALHDESVIAGVLLLYGETGAHYHLGGSLNNFLSLRPNHFLFSEMIRRSSDKGKVYLHLGGGVTGQDALYDFKSSFSGEEPLTYYIGKSILKDDVYKRLNDAHIQLHGMSDYFPMYRTPVKIDTPLSSTK
ncbi:GNAT family N-acetyltransferase [Exiguobacterium marinum]|uniref:Lipid II:glycine glycyltransferase n=1 Tax=Exiguobacterium marinum TaxID=273528 RepID=A0ABY7X5G2_9BACL|nr:GNAT family N-acetyltransferase [Exiguobacterium marinum]WDH77205.1 GNAT family N-acetyltransferase [Exiguobacterium marinum]